MTARQVPPAIEGYTPIRLVGRGGFADVFAYQQRSPRRVVAVKVLAVPEDEDFDHAAAFEAEANYLADLSQHPAIVTVHDAGRASDGRPYIVMEYCSRPGFGAIYRHQRLGVAEVLRVGVRLASAVETAHRAGVLHRDIKPANVLLTDYGWPALADFGIAMATGSEGVAAVSVPWAAPEVLLHDRVDVRSDVYSLGATLYALLAQRSPFEITGGANTPYDLLTRIERGKLPTIGRPDVPARLEGVFARALAAVDARYASAADLGRALQQVEAELALPVTELNLADGHRVAGWSDATLTRPRSAASVVTQPANALEPWQATRVRAVAEVGAHTWPSGTPVAGAPLEDATGDPDTQPPVRRRRGGLLAVVLGAAGAAVVATALVLALTLDGEPGDPEQPPTVVLPVGVTAPTPANLATQRTAAGVVVSWDNPQPLPGDSFAWSRTDAGAAADRTVTTDTTLEIPAAADERVCVEVLLVREDGTASTTPGSICDDGA